MNKYRPYMFKWCVAIRKREGGILNYRGQFHVIDNPVDGWCADPFLFTYHGQTYVFAEKYDYKKKRGSIAWLEVREDRMGCWHEAITEEFHMSYPYIWQDVEGIHICAETNEAHAIVRYTASDFPMKWKRDKIIYDRNRYADTTLLFDEKQQKTWMFTYGCDGLLNGKLFYTELDAGLNIMSSLKYITKNPKLARPGGAFIVHEDRLYRVAQDCCESYGRRISICEVNEISNMRYAEKLVFQRDYSELKFDKQINAIGMHTYNCNDQYEVVDLRMRNNDVCSILYYYVKGKL